MVKFYIKEEKSLLLKKASKLPRGAFSASLITRSHTCQSIDVEEAYVGLTVHRANSFQSRPAGDPVDSDPKPALLTRPGSTLTGVGTDGLIPHEVPPSTKL